MTPPEADGIHLTLRRAIVLEWVSIVWMTVEGGVSVAAGVAARSLSLQVFGLDSLVEIVTATTVLWRLRVQAGCASLHSEARVASAERLAARVVAVSLLVLAGYIVVGAAEDLRTRGAAHPGFWGFAVSVVALAGMPLLAAAKQRAARVLESEALREDAMGNLACGLMALIVLAGLVAQRVGLWWADPAAALLLGVVVLREGWEAWERAREGPPHPVRVFLGLGSNLGDRAQMLAQAGALLAGPDLRILAASRVYESPPWGTVDQPWFVNQVVEVRTALAPRALLSRCQEVEAQLGRVRTIRWGPRTIDVDILLYGALVMTTPDLVIPHAQLRNRAFALVPLAELAPGLRLPDGTTVESWLAAVPDRVGVREYLPDPHDAVGIDR